MSIYRSAWKLLLQRLESKTSWGKEELKRLMLQCFVDAGDSEDLVVCTECKRPVKLSFSGSSCEVSCGCASATVPYNPNNRWIALKEKQ